MKLKNNYNECITNLACSIRKYFGLNYNHNTLNYIDKILDERNPRNVVVILFDGMGSNILDKVLTSNSFFIKNRIKTITTVFPATTVAATTSIRTGLNPSETGMLGWNMYYKDIDKTITTFFNYEKGDPQRKPLKEAAVYKQKNMKEQTIVEEINNGKLYKGYELFPFGEDPYSDFDEMINKIEKLCKQKGKKYIYAYDEEPDHAMHEFGCDNKSVYDLIRYRNIMVEKLSKKLKDTLIVVIADHGHINVENIFLNDYPKIKNMLLRTTSLETRAVNLFVKDEYKDEFAKIFNDNFKDDFELCSKQNVIDSKLFGDGVENEIFRDALGDYIAIAKNNKNLIDDGDEILKSQHAGYTDDEINIPLIVI